MLALELTWTKLAIATAGATGSIFLLTNQLFWADGHWKGTVDNQLKAINFQVIRIEERLDRFENRFNKLEGKFENRFNKLEGKLDKILPIIYRLEQKLDSTYLDSTFKVNK